jgi:hypothetical protein
VVFQVIVAIDTKDVCHLWLAVFSFNVCPPISDPYDQEGF